MGSNKKSTIMIANQSTQQSNETRVEVNEVFDLEQSGYIRWFCFACWCDPFAACTMAKKLHLNNPWLYAVVGLLYYIGVILMEIAGVIHEINTEGDDDKEGRVFNDETCDEDGEKPETLVWVLFLIGDLIALIFGIGYVWMQYNMRRNFAKQTGLKEDENSSCCYVTTWHPFAYAQMGAHSNKVQLV